MKRMMTLCMATAMTLTANAANKDWFQNAGQPGGDWLWSNWMNWNLVLPTSADTVRIFGNTEQTPVLVDCDAVFSLLRLAPNAGDTAYLILQNDASMTGGGPDSNLIGANGFGQIIQNGGTFQAPRATVLGDASGAEGIYYLNAGTHTANWNSFIGNSGTGTLYINGGIWASTGDRTTIIGNELGSIGKVYNYGPGTFKHTGVGGGNRNLFVGNLGQGELYNWGTMIFERDIIVGNANTSGPIAKFHQLGGSISVGWSCYIGYNGRAEMKVEAPLYTRDLFIADQLGSYGYIEYLVGATNTFGAGRQLVVGVNGHAELIIKGGFVKGEGTNGRITVRANEDAYGLVQGWGEFKNWQSPLINNGLIIADGFGVDRELLFTDNNFMAYGHYFLDNTIPNTSTNGYYARNGGLLRLPGFYLDGAGDYLWGEALSATELTMVNSVRVKFDTVIGTHVMFNVDIIAPDRTDLPPLPMRGAVIGLWNINFPNAQIINQWSATTTSELEVRYDHVAARNITPELYQYNPSAKVWTKLETTSLSNHRLMTTDVELFNTDGTPKFSYIAAIRPTSSNVFYMR